MSEGIWNKKLLVAAVAAGTLVLVGCGEDDSTSSNSTNSAESSQYVSVNNPRGAITGLVTDTNGMPIEGATVYLGNQSVVTNAGGQYYFSDVAVSQTVRNDNDSYAQALALTIVPPAQYLKASVTVTPQAQIFNGSEANADSSEVTNPVTTFIDGFNASAGTAVLPEKMATVKGVLRSADSGEALAQVNLALDMISTASGVDQEQDQDGVVTSYGIESVTATTSATGAFEFSNVPADAFLKLAADGYTVSAQADTSDEYTPYELGNVKATKVLSEDTIAPWVKAVAQVVDQTATRGMLNDDVTTQFTIEFSETMAGIDVAGNSLLIRDVDGGAYLSHSASLNGKVLTVTLDSALVAGNEIDVLLLRDDFRDTAMPSNSVGTDKYDVATESLIDSPVEYDEDLITSVGSNYVRIKLKAYIEANQNAEAVDLTDTQQTEDVTGFGSLLQLQADNNAFLDVDDERDGIQQLNTADDNDSSNVADAAERMEDLAGAIAATVGYIDDTSVEANAAGIEFASTVADYYEMDVIGSNGLSKFNGLVNKRLVGATFDGGVANRFVSDVSEGEAVYLVVQGVEPGDIVTITPFDQFGYSGQAASLTLEDNVAPTTVLQKAYGVNADNNNGSVSSLQYGNGGEQSSTPDVEPGIPFLNITPRMLSVVDGTSDGTEELGVEGLLTLKPLFDLNLVNNIAGDANQGEYFIDELDFDAANIPGSTAGIYDAVAYGSWIADTAARTRTIGVAMSESVELTGTDPVADTTLNAAISNFVANNNVNIEDDGESTTADLVQFDITDVVTFGNQDHGSIIDFQASIQEASENAGSSNAKVVVGDALPPMVVSASYEGDEFVINFNEAIAIDTSTQIVLGGQTITMDIDTVNAFNGQTDKTVLSVLPSAWGDDLNRTAIFTLAQYNESDAASGSFPSDLYRHARLDFSDVEDVLGNSWNDFSIGNAADDNEFFFHQPDFAAIDETGTFRVTGTDDGTTLNSDTVSVQFTGTHPIDLSGWDGNNNGTIAQNEFENQFTFTDANGGGAEINTADDTHSLEVSNGGRTLTFTFVMVGNVEDGDNLIVNSAWESQWDASETSAPANSDVDFE
ncbi:carboxypeptidase-like regulatory domain-containing protein [Saccharospirillum impatiens]|uniref:carboxypeptidase-like regulatory domain-containing protein n=1 Tax=Saccharospirillum impatiens TaxID=169438 RepID=UPI00041A3560|nr:carboxypeptidase-like regulatory domain-containing protein [Saccharospirillum impatiens]